MRTDHCDNAGQGTDKPDPAPGAILASLNTGHAVPVVRRAAPRRVLLHKPFGCTTGMPAAGELTSMHAVATELRNGHGKADA